MHAIAKGPTAGGALQSGQEVFWKHQPHDISRKTPKCTEPITIREENMEGVKISCLNVLMITVYIGGSKMRQMHVDYGAPATSSSLTPFY